MTEKKVTVFGVSTDTVEAQKKFVAKEKLNYRLISDPEGKVMDGYGVGRIGGKFAKRRSFLFRNGKLVWKDEKGLMKTQGEEVLKAIEELEK